MLKYWRELQWRQLQLAGQIGTRAPHSFTTDRLFPVWLATTIRFVGTLQFIDRPVDPGNGVTMAELDDNPLMAEILAETATAYFGTIRKMQAAIAALAQFDQKQDSNSLPDAERKRRRNELFAEAAEQAWFFIVQRDAMKLSHYEELFADFQIPDEVRKRMGPKETKGTGGR
jgi:hypothetical protein